MNANLIFETLNGAWTIALTFVIIFVLFYLYEISREVTLRTFLFDKSLPEQFAIAILISDLGNWLVRGSTWAWRNSGADLGHLHGAPFIGVVLGAFISTVGVLCTLRILSIVRFGRWPWIACIAAVVIYISMQLAF